MLTEITRLIRLLSHHQTNTDCDFNHVSVSKFNVMLWNPPPPTFLLRSLKCFKSKETRFHFVVLKMLNLSVGSFRRAVWTSGAGFFLSGRWRIIKSSSYLLTRFSWSFRAVMCSVWRVNWARNLQRKVPPTQTGLFKNYTHKVWRQPKRHNNTRQALQYRSIKPWY